MKKILIFIVIPLFIVICVVSGLILELLNYADTPAKISASNKVTVNVRPGQTLKVTADILHQESIIEAGSGMLQMAKGINALAFSRAH